MIEGSAARNSCSLHRTKHLAALHSNWAWGLAAMIEGVLLHGLVFIAQSKDSSNFACSLVGGRHPWLKGVLLHGTVLFIVQNKASSDFAFSLGLEFGSRD